MKIMTFNVTTIIPDTSINNFSNENKSTEAAISNAVKRNISDIATFSEVNVEPTTMENVKNIHVKCLENDDIVCIYEVKSKNDMETITNCHEDSYAYELVINNDTVCNTRTLEDTMTFLSSLL